MSEPPLWLLKALAGRANAVAWPDAFKCTYKVESVTTSLYPIEHEEETKSDASILGGWGIEIQQEHFAASSLLIGGEVIAIYDPVSFTQYHENLTAQNVLIGGVITKIYEPIDLMHGYDSFYSKHAIIERGDLWGGVLATAPDEEMTSGFVEMSGEFV